MSTVLLEHLVDDAALFPPGNAPMPLAVGLHHAVKVGPLSWLVGRFLCPASRLDELTAELRPDDGIALGLIADTGVAGLPAALDRIEGDPRLVLLAVEIAVPPQPDLSAGTREVLAALPSGVRCYVEIPRATGWQAALAQVAVAGQGAKLRTGGERAAAFPTDAEVAAFIVACVSAGMPFKCTAGLHRAVRHTERRTRFRHHGFLNLTLAVCAAVRGDDPSPALANRHKDRIGAAVDRVDDDTATRARALFAGFGSCSISEPAADLLAMGLLGQEPR
ncbi:MAG: hypothetical protein WCB04_01070 [Mycobacteriales bacterium]